MLIIIVCLSPSDPCKILGIEKIKKEINKIKYSLLSKIFDFLYEPNLFKKLYKK